MVDSVEILEERTNENARKAVEMFAEKCESVGLNKTSVAALLGVSRQTLMNYRDGKVPCRGAIVRLKLVYPLITQAEDAELLPVASRKAQGALVETILNQ